MVKNMPLSAAKSAKNDEFCTVVYASGQRIKKCISLVLWGWWA